MGIPGPEILSFTQKNRRPACTTCRRTPGIRYYLACSSSHSYGWAFLDSVSFITLALALPISSVFPHISPHASRAGPVPLNQHLFLSPGHIAVHIPFRWLRLLSQMPHNRKQRHPAVWAWCAIRGPATASIQTLVRIVGPAAVQRTVRTGKYIGISSSCQIPLHSRIAGYVSSNNVTQCVITARVAL